MWWLYVIGYFAIGYISSVLTETYFRRGPRARCMNCSGGWVCFAPHAPDETLIPFIAILAWPLWAIFSIGYLLRGGLYFLTPSGGADLVERGVEAGRKRKKRGTLLVEGNGDEED